MQVQIDTDLILEAILNRNRFVTKAEKAYKILCSSSQIQGYLTSCGLEKIYSIAQDINGFEAAEKMVTGIKEVIKICQVDSSVIQQARLLNIEDPESAIEVASALTNGIWSILTLSPKNFIGSNLSILSVKNLLFRQSLESQLFYFPTSRINYKNSELTKSLSQSYKIPIKLTNWLENNFKEAFQSNWQSVEDILGKQIKYRYRYAAMAMQWSKLAKVINLVNERLILVVQVALNQFI